MKLIITYEELQNIILRKTKKNICFRKVAESNTVKAIYKIEVDVPLLGNLSKDIDCDITFNGINGTELDPHCAASWSGLLIIVFNELL